MNRTANERGDALPHRLDTAIPLAVDIALLARDPAVSLTAAAGLIEQYARTRASEAAADAVLETGNRLIAAIDAPLARKEPV
ncbi:MAG TPA: hypothetical protein VGH13_11580 [Xanthobacteraceae bacterium]|jgi:hypothetical protein